MNNINKSVFGLNTRTTVGLDLPDFKQTRMDKAIHNVYSE